MDLQTLDVHTADGHTLKVGVCANGCTGPSVLILPGLYSHMGWYRPLGEALAKRGAAAFLVDRRGAGISGGVPGHMDSWRHVVEDIRRVVVHDQGTPPSASVCALGVSLGAAMTLATSLVHPDCFQRQALALARIWRRHSKLPLLRRIGLAYRGFARPRFSHELPYTMDQLSDQEELRQACGAIRCARARSPRASCRGLPHAALTCAATSTVCACRSWLSWPRRIRWSTTRSCSRP
jgi:pimeloyl-ACP methyl ester carboxylesterase